MASYHEVLIDEGIQCKNVLKNAIKVDQCASKIIFTEMTFSYSEFRFVAFESSGTQKFRGML